MLVDIIRYGNNGEGIAQKDGKVIFVLRALVGETVDISIEKDYAKYSISKLNKIIKQSQNRVNPPCPYFNVCGGCQLQHAKYQEQLKIKSLKISGNLKKYANFDGICEIKPSFLKYNYRNHMRFAVVNKKLCLHKNKSEKCIEIDYCHIACDAINLCIQPINNFLSSQNIDIVEVDIKAIKEQVLITFIAKNDALNLNVKSLESHLSPFFTFGFYLYNRKTKNLKHLGGFKKIECKNSLITYIRPLSFLQINNEISNIMYNDVCEFVKDEIVVDAFSGRGLLTCLLSQKAKKVFGIEIEKSSVLDAIDMQKQNNIQNVEFILGDANKVLSQLNKNIDCLVLDPPRAGIQNEMIFSILKMLPKKIIYISCASNTLARDLKLFLNKYSIKSVQGYDMFPETDEVETVVLLEKINE